MQAREERTELDDWRQAAQTEASLRREFLARAEAAEAEVKRLRQRRDELLRQLANARVDEITGCLDITSLFEESLSAEKAPKAAIEAVRLVDRAIRNRLTDSSTK